MWNNTFMRTGGKLSTLLIIFTFFIVFGAVLCGVYRLGRSNIGGRSFLSDERALVNDEVLGSEQQLDEETEINEKPVDYTDEPSVDEVLTELFSLKYEKPKEEIIIGISESTEKYAMGGVSFKGELAGGWFLAANLDGEWEIVQDGNGSIICQIIEPYDFPGNMVPTCYDQEKMVVIARTGPDAPKPAELEGAGEIIDDTEEYAPEEALDEDAVTDVPQE
jgi:hypothetical protein